MKKSITYRLIRVTLITLVAIQFLPIDRSVPEYEKENDFIMSSKLDDQYKSLIRNACYDCHSYQTDYPWYSKVAPISFSIQGHINEGREHLNFSKWEIYTPSKKEKLLEEAAEEIHGGEMPLTGYRWLHKEARLSDLEQKELVDALRTIR